jgi:hypothetical protein
MEYLVNLRLPLFRGDAAHAREHALACGVHGTHPRSDELAALNMPPALVARAGVVQVHTHVLYGSAGSPFASWSQSPDVARRFATNRERRPGILIRSDLLITSIHVWEGPDGWASGYRDGEGRVLLVTGNYRTALMHPTQAQAVRTLGTEDQEYLVLGHIYPPEISIEVVMPRRSRLSYA